MNDQRLLRVLFVDDETRILDGLQRMLRPLRHEWEMTFVDSGEAALAEMAKAPFDVVVSDMRMPKMSGAELLTRVMRDHPATVRLILSGQAERELVHRTVGPTHQYLSKPCDAETLKATVDRASRLRLLLNDDRLRKLTARLDRLPSLPALYQQMVELLQKPGTSLTTIGELVAKDLGMSIKVLQLVNSAFFGMRRTIANPVEAVNLLGVETIQSLVLSVHVFCRLDQSQMDGFDLDTLWQHSMAVSALAKRIALAEGLEKPRIEECLMAGMMHDVGRVVLAINLPQDYAHVQQEAKLRGCSLLQCEREILGASHAEIGAYLLGLWGISQPIVEAVAFHHTPQIARPNSFSPVTAVHVADILHHVVTGTSDSGTIDGAHLGALGLTHRVPAWVELAKVAAGDGNA